MTEIRNLEGLAEYAHEQIERIEQMQRDLTRYAGEGTSPGGHVFARTGPGGTVLDLRIEPSALRLPAEEVADEVRAAIGAAQQEYARRADDIMAPVLGMRPSEQAVDSLERGMSRLDALTADLERLAHDRRLIED